jgi:hypothetical protein
MAMPDAKAQAWARSMGIQLPVQTKTYEQHEAERKRKQQLFAPDYETEAKASVLVKNFLNRNEWDWEEEVNTGAGNRIDFVVNAYDERLKREVKFGIECKRRLSKHYTEGIAATVLADYLEQAAAYSKALNMPVFIGPVQAGYSPSSAYVGGLTVDSLCALNIFGGRFNVGTLNFGDSRYHREFLILRGATFWEPSVGFNPKRLKMVTSTGSKKQRTDL